MFAVLSGSEKSQNAAERINPSPASHVYIEIFSSKFILLQLSQNDITHLLASNNFWFQQEKSKKTTLVRLKISGCYWNPASHVYIEIFFSKFILLQLSQNDITHLQVSIKELLVSAGKIAKENSCLTQKSGWPLEPSCKSA